MRSRNYQEAATRRQLQLLRALCFAAGGGTAGAATLLHVPSPLSRCPTHGLLRLSPILYTFKLQALRPPLALPQAASTVRFAWERLLGSHQGACHRTTAALYSLWCMRDCADSLASAEEAGSMLRLVTRGANHACWQCSATV